MANRAADVFETLKTALKGKSLDASLKFELGDENVIVIDGPVVTTDNVDADTVVTTSVEVLASWGQSCLAVQCLGASSWWEIRCLAWRQHSS